MAQLKLLDVKEMIAYYLPGDDALIYSNAINRNNPKSIGVFTAPESRMGETPTFGGPTFAPVKIFPVNILVRWGEDSDEAEVQANEIYNMLESLGQNFLVRENDPLSTRIAFIKLLDSHPVWIGRDDKNICEYTIRVDIFYYK